MAIKYLFLSLLVFVFFGCHNHAQKTTDGHDHEQETEEHDHEHGDVKLQLTAYSNDFEVFAEADPLATGHSSEVLAHFSFLKNFKPLENGGITATLQAGDKKVSQTLDQPDRKGIYKFELTPETSGAARLTFILKTDSGQFEVVVPDLQVFADDHEAIHEAEELVSSKTNTVTFTKEQSWKIDFATELSRTESFGQVIKTTAIVENAPEDEELVSAKTSGIVRFTQGNLTEGKSVSAGQGLFVISGDDMAENNSVTRFAEAKNNYEKAKTDFDRLTELAKEKIVSERDLLEGRTKYENAKAIYTNLNTNFSAKGQTVKAPMSGFIKRLYAQNGQFVEAGQPLVSVSKNQKLVLRADVQQKYAGALASVSSAIIRLPNSNETYSLEQLGGKILSYGRSANSDNFLIPVILQVNNSGIFTSGGFTELFLKTQSGVQSLTIPNSSIMEEQGSYFVFVQVHPELFEKREIVPGATDGMRTEVKSGIQPNERIVSKGAILVKLAQSSGALDAHSGHVH